MKFKSLVAAMGVAITTLVSTQVSALDEKLPEYNKTSGISGN
ncbi:phosphate-binding protein, partial [Pseudoalteromonas ruthenica]